MQRSPTIAVFLHRLMSYPKVTFLLNRTTFASRWNLLDFLLEPLRLPVGTSSTSRWNLLDFPLEPPRLPVGTSSTSRWNLFDFPLELPLVPETSNVAAGNH